MIAVGERMMRTCWPTSSEGTHTSFMIDALPSAIPGLEVETSSTLLLYHRGRKGRHVPVGHNKIGETDIGAYHYDVFVFPGSTTMVTWSATTEPPHRFLWMFDKPQEDLLNPNFDDVGTVVIQVQWTHGMVSHSFSSIWAAEAAERAKQGTVDAYVRDLGRMIEWADLGPAK